MAENVLYLKQDDATFFCKGDFDIDSLLSGGGGGGGGGSTDPATPIVFSSTSTVTVGNTGTSTTLLSTGEGSLAIGAGDWDAGQKLVIELSGVYSTHATLPGAVDFLVQIGSALTLTLSIASPPVNQTNQLFVLKAEFVRISEGASGTVVGWAKVSLYDTANQETTDVAVTSSPQTVDSTATQTLDVEVDWATASSSNTITQQSAVVQKLGILTP